MAFTVTDRGTTRTEQRPGTTTTTTSASFTPSAGALLVCLATGQISDSSANSTFSISDTFTGTTGPDGTGTWHQDTVNWLEGTQTTRVSIFTAKLGASPGTGTVTLTFNYASNVNREFNLTVLEVTGQKTANFTNVNSTGNVVATSITVTMGSTPSPVSLQVGACFDSAGSATTITAPSGWTEVVQKKPTAGGGIHEVAYAIGLATAAPQWTTLSGVGNTQGAMAIEILTDLPPVRLQRPRGRTLTRARRRAVALRPPLPPVMPTRSASRRRPPSPARRSARARPLSSILPVPLPARRRPVRPMRPARARPTPVGAPVLVAGYIVAPIRSRPRWLTRLLRRHTALPPAFVIIPAGPTDPAGKSAGVIGLYAGSGVVTGGGGGDTGATYGSGSATGGGGGAIVESASGGAIT